MGEIFTSGTCVYAYTCIEICVYDDNKEKEAINLRVQIWEWFKEGQLIEAGERKGESVIVCIVILFFLKMLKKKNKPMYLCPSFHMKLAFLLL